MEVAPDEDTLGGEPPWARQSRLFQAICWAARELSSGPAWGDSVGSVVERLGRAARASGGFLVRPSPAGEERALELRWAWAEDLGAEGRRPGALHAPASGFERWAEPLGRGELVRGDPEELAASERKALHAFRVRSVLVAPVFTTAGWWGGLGLGCSDASRQWDATDEEALRAVAGVLGGAVERELLRQRAVGSAPGGAALESTVRERAAESLEANAALERELSERTRAEGALERQVEELARSNAELEQFAYFASHDLQQPLVAVIGFLKLLEQRYAPALDEDARTFIGQSLEGANRMQLLVRDLLEYSRSRSSAELATPVDVEELLDDALQNLRQALEESGASVTRDPLPVVEAAPTQLAQVFQNLVGNALKFAGGRPPRVHVSAARRGGEWLFSVADNGIGIAPEDREKIFRIFERLHGRSKYPGTGIGLAICKKAVERNGGRIWVESQPGAGSTFYFTIPAREA